MGSEHDMEEILSHEWFKNIDVEDIKSQLIEPPFKPIVKNQLDTKYFKREAKK